MFKGFSLALLVSAIVMLGGGEAMAGTHHRFIDDNDTVVLRGNTHPLARSMAQGLAPASLPMQHMIMSLQIPSEKQPVLQDFLKQQHDPASPNYHKWLTPEQFGEKFGPAPEDVAAVSDWLGSHGFKVEEVAKSRTWINFSGDALGVEQAFKTQMKSVQVGGHTYHANAVDPSLPRGLAGVAAGIVTLHNIPRQPKHYSARLFASDQEVPNYTSGSGNHYLAPGDFATIYNVKPLYSSGIDGTGQSIAIVGRTHPSTANWSSFRTAMGLPSNPPQVIVNGTDPGDLGSGEDTEANLDVEWAGAVAKGATIKFVTSKSTYSTDGVDLSAQYIVSNNIAPVMSLSFGSCESDMGSAENTFYNNLWAQAAAQGITVLVSAGDSGAAGCSDPSIATGSGKAINGLASTPYNIAVGGTQFNEGGGSYWNSVNSTDSTSATGYIPELAWNESGSVSGGSGLWATGGGVSTIYSKPAWQLAPGVPQDGKRDIPDLSLSGAGHDAYLIYTGGSLGAVGGTSASAPSLAGVMALVVQKTGQRQGNANPQLYRLGNSQYALGGTAIFHDITGSSNSVPGVAGYSSGTGYDLATGLGSIDAYNLVNYWAGTTSGDFTLSAGTPSAITQGSSGSLQVSTSGVSGFNSAVSLTASGLPAGVTANFAPASIAAPGAGSSALTLAVSSSAAVGTSSITVTATGGGSTHSVQVPVTIQAPVVVQPPQPPQPAQPAQTVVLLSSSFADSWYASYAIGSIAKWDIVGSGSNPAAAPHSDSKMAQFSSYQVAAGNQARIYNNVRYALPSNATSATLTYWFNHDLNGSTYEDRMQPQLTTDGSNWVNVGRSVRRYNNSNGWAQVTVDLTPYLGQSIMIGFLGTSGGGYNMYVDDVTLQVN